jgi:hypothetical protein
MKKYVTIIGCLALGAFLTGCGQQPVAPVKEGVIWDVIWSDAPNVKTGLFRMKQAPTNSFGEYGVEMTGKLYPTFLEVQRAGNPHVQIIPLNQILALDFGE